MRPGTKVIDVADQARQGLFQGYCAQNNRRCAMVWWNGQPSCSVVPVSRVTLPSGRPLPVDTRHLVKSTTNRIKRAKQRIVDAICLGTGWTEDEATRRVAEGVTVGQVMEEVG